LEDNTKKQQIADFQAKFQANKIKRAFKQSRKQQAPVAAAAAAATATAEEVDNSTTTAAAAKVEFSLAAEAADEKEIQTANVTDVAEYNRLNRAYRKTQLEEYAASLGIALDPTLKKPEIINEIINATKSKIETLSPTKKQKQLQKELAATIAESPPKRSTKTPRTPAKK
jgi:hypothetical protein